MSDNKPDKVNDLLEAAINNSTQAWDAQSKYFDDFIKRNVAAFATLSDARIESLLTNRRCVMNSGRCAKTTSEPGLIWK
jgi:hypothetical protein